MAEHPNVERVRRGYEAFKTGDLQALRELFDESVVWHVPGNSALAGDYKGIEEVFGFFGRILEETQGTLKQEVHDVLANDDHAVALLTVNAERNGKRLEWRDAHISHVSPQGKVTEFWVFSEDNAAVDAFWS